MKKIIIGLLIVVVLGLAVFFILKSNGWQIYKNSRYEFSVEYPANWTLGEPETNNAGRTFIEPKTGVQCFAYGFANALTNEQGEPQTLEEFVDWLTVDTRVGEGLYTNVIERTNTTLDGQSAVYVFMEQDMDLKEAIYTLGSEEGHGLYCMYNDKEEWNTYKNVFEKMKNSFKMTTEQVSFGSFSCSNLLAGASTPFKDFQTFRDTKYTEVTMTSRDAWDKDMLPKQVVNLEKKSYECFPMPTEFEGGEPEGGVMAEPMVTEVEWTCELEYNDWKYLEGNDTVGKQVAEKVGFACEKQNCFTDGPMINEVTVWLCTK
ncbi:hypothetical protein KKA94_03285 [Patescibacteria group bacterium]|nr:hypothetical protein [Patescibacteria group bacterium]